MKTNFKTIKVKDIVEKYVNNTDEGVKGYNGRLNIRPAYQREFIYNDKQQKAVIDTILKGFPLNTMYWSVNNDKYELIDGQQRILSICKFVNGEFDVDSKFFHNLDAQKKEQILNYELQVYLCEATNEERKELHVLANT